MRRIFIWDATYFCPLQCIYCYSDSTPSQPRTNPAQLRRVAAAIVREKPDCVNVSGGEPALLDGITEVGALFRENGIVAELLTSGWGLDEPRIRTLCAGFERIHVSLDAPDPDVNDRLRGKKGAHQNATRALRLLAEHRHANPRLLFGVECTVLKSNLKSIGELCTLVTQSFEGLSFINIAPAVPSGRGSRLERCLSELLSEDEVAYLLSQEDEVRRLLPAHVRLSIGSNQALRLDDDNFIQLTANGDVRAIKICEKTIGNIVDESLDSILERATKWREGTALARRLRTVPTFVEWADIVRQIDQR